MKRKLLMLFLALLFVLVGCTGQKAILQAVHLAVMVEDRNADAEYIRGVELAIHQARKEYSDVLIDYTIYEDYSNYEIGAGIINAIASNSDITAVLASSNMDISKTAAYEFESAGKLMLAPFALYDDVLIRQNYKMVFSTCFSAAYTGNMARMATNESGVSRWAVCYSEDEFSRQEARSFSQQREDNIQIVDLVKEDMLRHNISSVAERWTALDVEGIALFCYDVRVLDLFMDLKRINPSWRFVGDFAMDDSEFLDASPEHMAAFEGVSLVDQFHVTDDPKDSEIMSELVPEEDIETWLIHGYNNAKMVVDTAVKNAVYSGAEIAEYLHRDGYNGLCQTFVFDEKGQLTNPVFVYYTYEQTEWNEYHIEAGNEP